MRFVLPVIALLLCFCTNAQRNSETADFYKVLSIGDSILKFQNLLSCVGDQSNEISILDGSLTCRAFRFLPADKDSFAVGNVKFRTVFLTPDSSKKIKTVDLINSYLRTDSTDPKRMAARDFESLRTFLSSTFQSQGKKFIPEFALTEHYSQDAWFWQAGNTKYILIKTKFKRKKVRQKLTHSVALSYFKVE